MTGIFGIVLVAPVIAYFIFAEFISRREESRYQTDIGDDGPNLLIDARRTSDAGNLKVADKPKPAEKVKDTPFLHSWKGWREMIVDSIRDESPDCRSFKFRPRDGGPMPRFKGGQSILVRCPTTDGSRPVSRCYSLSSGPGEEHFRITVKRVPDGRMSRQLHDTIEVGDLVEIQSPRGHFHIDESHLDRPLHLIAAGIGITPMLSMLLQSLEETPHREVHLYYQLRDQGNAPFLKAMRFLSQSPVVCETFRLHIWFSRPHNDTNVSADQTTGRICAHQIIDRLGHARGDFRICGPNEFMASMAEGLIQYGADESSVQYESFGGKAKGPGAIAVAPDYVSQAKTDSAVVTHQVKFCKSELDANWSDGESTLLDVAEAAGANVDSSCRTGQCGSCIHRLIAGSVKYAETPECEFGDDEVVLCVAQPDGDIEIDA